MAHTRPKWGHITYGSSAALAGPIGVFIHATMIGVWWSLIFLNCACLFYSVRSCEAEGKKKMTEYWRVAV
jgi:hypothetical protein